MKKFYIKIHEIHEGIYIDADEISETYERLVFFKNNEKIAEIKEWDYWLEFFE